MPAYLAFQLYSVASEMPWRRHTSFVLPPASDSFSTAMICSSVNRLPFIVRSSLGRTLLAFRTNLGCQVASSQTNGPTPVGVKGPCITSIRAHAGKVSYLFILLG